MKADITNEQGYLIIHFSGEIDLHSRPHSREIILDCLGQGRNTILDLSAVTYLDSSGVASFVEGYKYAKENGIEFGLMNINELVTKVLQMARLDTVFPIYNSLSQGRI